MLLLNIPASFNLASSSQVNLETLWCGRSARNVQGFASICATLVKNVFEKKDRKDHAR